MKFLVVSALFSAALLVASTPIEVEERDQAKWDSFKVIVFPLFYTLIFFFNRFSCLFQAAHGKNYHPHEEQARKTNFLLVDARIKDHNSNASASFKMVHNHLSDWVRFFFSLFECIAQYITSQNRIIIYLLYQHPHEIQSLLGSVQPARTLKSPNSRSVTDDELELNDRITPPPASVSDLKL